MFSIVFANTVSSNSLTVLSWMMTMSGRAVVCTIERGTVDGGLSSVLWPGRSAYRIDPSGSCDLSISTIWVKTES